MRSWLLFALLSLTTACPRGAPATTPRGGMISVRARVQGERFVFTIRDEGHGMSEEEMDRLFTPFAHSFPGGTGLGLAIVYRIVE